jgi:hypothetical protein
MEKIKGRETRRARADSPMVVETEVEKSFWLSRPDGWVINRKTKKIMLLEFKRTSDLQVSGRSEKRSGWKPLGSSGSGKRMVKESSGD